MITSQAHVAAGFQLTQTTERLRMLLNSLFTGEDDLLTRVATPAEMSILLSELMRTGAWLRNLSELDRARIEREVEGYRIQVERLRRILPFLQSALLSERARLESERDRVDAASEWMQASRQTF